MALQDIMPASSFSEAKPIITKKISSAAKTGKISAR